MRTSGFVMSSTAPPHRNAIKGATARGDTDMTTYDRLTANPPDEPHEIGHEEDETCGRYPEPDEDQPRGYRPKRCRGRMDSIGNGLYECDTCGEIGE